MMSMRMPRSTSIWHLVKNERNMDPFAFSEKMVYMKENFDNLMDIDSKKKGWS